MFGRYVSATSEKQTREGPGESTAAGEKTSAMAPKWGEHGLREQQGIQSDQSQRLQGRRTADESGAARARWDSGRGSPSGFE